MTTTGPTFDVMLRMPRHVSVLACDDNNCIDLRNDATYRNSQPRSVATRGTERSLHENRTS